MQENGTATYIKVNNFLVDQYENYKHKAKRLISVNLKLEGSNQNAAGIWVYSTIGKLLVENNLKSSSPFQDYDWWHALDIGRCNGYNSTHPSTENAMNQLERYYITHNNAFKYLNPYYYDYYFTDIEGPHYCYGHGSDWDMYVWDSWNYDECISPELMNYFLQHIDDVIVDNLSGGRQPFNLQVGYTGLSTIYLHMYEFESGRYHGRAIPALMRPERL